MTSRGTGRGGRSAAERGSRIHAGLVGARALVGTPYLADPALRREYAEEIAPRTGVALDKILRELFGAGGGRFRGRGPRVLDLGAGTGAAGRAMRAFNSGIDPGIDQASDPSLGPAMTITAVDRIAHIAGPGMVTADLGAPGPLRGVSGPFDIIVAAHLINELYTQLPDAQRIDARASRILAWCQSLLAPDGTMIILEPALRETSRALLAVRDRLLTEGLQVVAPCLWQGPCPALLRERDWCHDAATPKADDASAARHAARRVDFSYLALRRRDAPPVVDPALVRIVSDPLQEKGRLRFFACGPAGRDALVRLDRHRTPANQIFDRLARGDLVRVAGTRQLPDGWRIEPETTVEPSTVASDGFSAESPSR